MSAEENKALVRRFYEEIDKGNIDAMDELVAEDYLDHSPPPFPGLGSGRAGLKQVFQTFLDATPGYHRIDDQVAEGDKVVTRLTAVGKHEADLPGIPKTGNDLEMTATVVHRIAGGKLADRGSAILLTGLFAVKKGSDEIEAHLLDSVTERHDREVLRLRGHLESRKETHPQARRPDV